jgi:prolyl 4-hydroxylase
MPSLNEAVALIDSGQIGPGVQMLRHIASEGQARALYVLAQLTWTGTHVTQDSQRGRLLFEYAAARGDAQSNLLLTNFLASGIAGKRDWGLAMERLSVEARQLPNRRAALEIIARMDLDKNGDPRAIPSPRVVADQPYARLFENLLTANECAYLVSASEGRFEPSMVFNRARELVRDTIRTSDGAAFHWLLEDPAVHAINRRVAAASRTPYDQGEPLQVLRYSPGQEYRPHFDYVDEADNRRLWTALIYLNDDYEGGATAFVRTELKVRGRMGSVLLFRNANERDEQDALAEHAGMPVTSGTKYLATRWIRERRWIP